MLDRVIGFSLSNRLLVLVKTLEPDKKTKGSKKQEPEKKEPEKIELDVKGTLEKLVTHGLRMREDDELNRFRLVLVSKEPKKLEKELEEEEMLPALRATSATSSWVLEINVLNQWAS